MPVVWEEGAGGGFGVSRGAESRGIVLGAPVGLGRVLSRE